LRLTGHSGSGLFSRAWLQDDFDAGSIQLSADYFTATPAGSPLTLQISGSTLTLSLDQRPSLSLQVQLGPAVTRGGKPTHGLLLQLGQVQYVLVVTTDMPK